MVSTQNEIREMKERLEMMTQRNDYTGISSLTPLNIAEDQNKDV